MMGRKTKVIKQLKKILSDEFTIIVDDCFDDDSHFAFNIKYKTRSHSFKGQINDTGQGMYFISEFDLEILKLTGENIYKRLFEEHYRQYSFMPSVK